LRRGNLPTVTEEELRAEIEAATLRRSKADEEVELLSRLLELHASAQRSNIPRMLPNVQSAAPDTRSRGVKIMTRRARDLTPSRLACIEAELSDPMIAKLTKCGRSTVQAWHTGLRPIPRAAAKLLSELKPRPIPLHVWKRIQD
jgi:DNA-binding transcriptional regulator YiaG